MGLLQIQRKLCKRLAQADVQSQLQDLAATWVPDGTNYLAGMQGVVVAEEAKIYRSIGFLTQDIKALRREALRLSAVYMKTAPKLKELSHKLISLTWPSNSESWQW